MALRPSYKNIKKDYQHKNLANPFFHKKAKPKQPHRRKWLILAAILAVIGLIWFFFAAPLWQIKQIKVSGLTHLNSAELEQIVWAEAGNRRGLFFSEHNIHLFREDEVISQVVSTYNFSGAEIKKVWPNTIELKVIERPYAFIFQEGSAYYYASQDAYIIKEPPVSEENKTKYFTLENRNSASMITPSDKINIKNDYLSFIFELSQQLANYPELPVEKFIIDQEFNTVKAKLVDGPVVLFKVKEGAEAQISRLLLVKREKIKDNFSKTNYIDLRYGDKIFINPDFN